MATWSLTRRNRGMSSTPAACAIAPASRAARGRQTPALIPAASAVLDEVPHEVGFREDADEVLSFHDRKAADLVLDEHLGRVAEVLLRLDRLDLRGHDFADPA